MMLKNEVWKIGKTFLVIFMFCVIYFVCFYNQIDFKKNINFSLSDSGIYNSSNCTIEDAIKVCLLFTHFLKSNVYILTCMECFNIIFFEFFAIEQF